MDTTALLGSAARGDQAAWDALVERFTSLLWSITRSYRLPDSDAADVVQTTWLRLVEHLDRIDDPQRLAGWLATTTRRECLQQIKRSGRERPVSDTEPWDGVAAPDTAVDRALLIGERNAALWQALESLSEPCQRLLRVLMATPPPPYTDVSAALGIPVGSIGPSRQRCLKRLREVVAGDGVLGDGALEDERKDGP